MVQSTHYAILVIEEFLPAGETNTKYQWTRLKTLRQYAWDLEPEIQKLKEVHLGIEEATYTSQRAKEQEIAQKCQEIFFFESLDYQVAEIRCEFSPELDHETAGIVASAKGSESLKW